MAVPKRKMSRSNTATAAHSGRPARLSSTPSVQGREIACPSSCAGFHKEGLIPSSEAAGGG